MRKCLSTIQPLKGKLTEVQRGRTCGYKFYYKQHGALERRALTKWRFPVQNTSTPETFAYPVILFFSIVYLIWSLTLREERMLRVFENRVLRGIFGPKGDGVTGEWRRLRNEELNYLCSSPNIVRVIKSRKMRWAGHVARMGQRRGVYRVLVGKPEGRRPLARHRRRWEDNNKMDVQEVGSGGMDWSELAQDRDRRRALVNAVMNFRVT